MDISPIFPQYQLHVPYNFLSFDDDIQCRRLTPATKESSVEIDFLIILKKCLVILIHKRRVNNIINFK